MQALTDSSLSDRLYWLDLSHNRLDDAGAAALLNGDWPALAWLNLRQNGLSRSAREALRQRFGSAVLF